MQVLYSITQVYKDFRIGVAKRGVIGNQQSVFFVEQVEAQLL